MLLRRKMNDMTGRRMVTLGMAACALGIVASRLGTMHLGISDFAEGFLLGFGLVLMMASIVLNTRGFVKMRAEGSDR
jgi:hypothetical protein